MTFEDVGTLFYAAELLDSEVVALAYAPAFVAHFVDPLGPCTQVDLADGVPQDWELGVPFLPAMDEVRVTTARLDLRGLRVPVPAEGWTATAQSKGFRITLAQPARLVAIAFDPPQPATPLADGQTLRLLLSPADPAGPPSFVDPPFPLGAAYAAIPRRIGQRSDGGLTVADLDPTFGTSWLVQWAVGNDATELAPVDVTTTVRSVTVEAAVADARLELRPDVDGGDPVLVWNHPGVLDPASGLQPVDMSPIARKRLADRLTAANGAASPPPTLTLPVRLVAATGGPVGVSGTELRVDYAADGLPGGAALALRGEPRPLTLSVPAALRPAGGTVSVTAHHLGRELNGPVGPIAAAGGPGRQVTVARWAATALAVAAPPTGDASVTIVAVTVDVAADSPAELALDLRADVHGLPGPVLASAVARLDAGPRSVIELLLDRPPTVAVAAVVWVTARATTGVVRWYDDPVDRRPALPALPPPEVRVSADGGLTWAPDEGSLAGPTVPRTRLLHHVDPPYAAPVLAIRTGDDVVVAEVALAAGGAPDEFAAAAAPLPAALADLAGRTVGAGRRDLALYLTTPAALDLRVTAVDLVYPPSAGPTGS